MVMLLIVIVVLFPLFHSLPLSPPRIDVDGQIENLDAICTASVIQHAQIANLISIQPSSNGLILNDCSIIANGSIISASPSPSPSSGTILSLSGSLNGVSNNYFGAFGGIDLSVGGGAAESNCLEVIVEGAAGSLLMQGNEFEVDCDLYQVRAHTPYTPMNIPF